MIFQILLGLKVFAVVWVIIFVVLTVRTRIKHKRALNAAEQWRQSLSAATPCEACNGTKTIPLEGGDSRGCYLCSPGFEPSPVEPPTLMSAVQDRIKAKNDPRMSNESFARTVLDRLSPNRGTPLIVKDPLRIEPADWNFYTDESTTPVYTIRVPRPEPVTKEDVARKLFLDDNKCLAPRYCWACRQTLEVLHDLYRVIGNQRPTADQKARIKELDQQLQTCKQCEEAQ